MTLKDTSKELSPIYEPEGKILGENKIDLKLFDPQRPRAQALIRSVAYKLARLNDPSGGRLSDFDVEQALGMLTGGQPITSPFGIRNALDVIEDQARNKIRTFAPRFGSSFEQEMAGVQQAQPSGQQGFDNLDNATLNTIANDPSLDQAMRERALKLLEQRLTQ